MVQEKRDVVPQIMKGFAILFVVTHHSITAMVNLHGVLENVIACINGFHVAVFFAISGFFTAKSLSGRSSFDRKSLWNRVERLLFPYFSWQLLFWLLISIAYFIPQLEPIALSAGIERKSFTQMLVSLILFVDSYTEIFWFIYVLIMYTIIVYCLTIKNCTKPIVLTIVFATFLVMCGQEELPFIIKKSFIHLPEFWLGIVTFARYPRVFALLDQRKNNLIIIVVIGLLFFSLGYLRYFTGFFSSLQNGILLPLDNVFRLTYSTLGVITIALFSSVISQKCAGGTLLKKIGDQSFHIYLIYQPWVVALGSVLLRKMRLPTLVAVVLLLSAAIVIPIIVALFFSKNRILRLVFLG